MKRDIVTTQSIFVDEESYPETTSLTTQELMLEGYSLSFGEASKVEARIYEIYHQLVKRHPRLQIEVRHPSLFKPALTCIKYQPFLWSLIE